MGSNPAPRRPAVAVVIPAFNARDSIAAAVRSALEQRECAELVVVDDGSSDDTAKMARSANDGSRRLRILRQPNRGPSAAINAGQDATRSPFLCVLDADDVFLPGRLERLFGGEADPGWDMAADRLLLADHAAPQGPYRPWLGRLPASGRLTFAAFVEGNISRPGAPRAELGYLQPVFRRAFLDAHGLRHDERVRIGEDYLLYARALGLGACFRVIEAAGYVATLRTDSLSARHSADDLAALLAADEAMRGLPRTAEGHVALERHVRHVRQKLALRRALDAKAQMGRWAGLAVGLRHWDCLPYLVAETLRARLAAMPVAFSAVLQRTVADTASGST